jgi:hypothetical protein
MSVSKIIYSLLVALMVSGFTYQPLPDVYIKMAHPGKNNNNKVVKYYGVSGSFYLTYKCGCYVDKSDLEFVFDYGKNSRTLLTKMPSKVINFDDFVELANKDFKGGKSLFKKVYLIEEIGEHTYVQYNVNFLSMPANE